MHEPVGFTLYQTTMIPTLPSEGELKIENMVKQLLKWTGPESRATILICSSRILHHNLILNFCIHWMLEACGAPDNERMVHSESARRTQLETDRVLYSMDPLLIG